MDNIFMVASIIAFLYLIIKFMEMRFVEKNNKPIKIIIKDTLVVYLCIFLGNYLIEQISPHILGKGVSTPKPTQVFTDSPSF